MFSSEKYGAIGFLILCIFASLVISQIFGLKEGMDDPLSIDLIKKASTPIPPIKDAIRELNLKIEAAKEQVKTAQDEVNTLTAEAGKAKYKVEHATQTLAKVAAKVKTDKANVAAAELSVKAAQR